MKLLSFALTLLVSIGVFAIQSTYRIDSQLFIDGKLVSSPKIITSAGEAAEITQSGSNPEDKLSFKVIPEDLSNEKIKNGILMSFNINYKYGSKTVKSSPQIFTKSGSESSILIEKSKDQEEVLLKVIATRE